MCALSGGIRKMEFTTLADALTQQMEGPGSITFIDADNRERSFSYRSLRSRALHVLHFFQRSGIRQGDELVLCVSSNVAFVDALWACLLGGIVPVPLALGSAKEHRRKVLNVLASLRRPALFTERGHLGRLTAYADEEGLRSQLHASRTLLMDDIGAEAKVGAPQGASSDDTALIQFSSGSTGDPKGVTLTHRNILSNIRGIKEGAGLTKADSTLSWMPLTHDMGLIGFHLTPLVMEMGQFILSTELFARRPMIWLEAVHEKRATMLGSPNFGYRHLLRAHSRLRAPVLDLSCVRLVFNGAEPISPVLCEEFVSALAPYGLCRDAIFPVYGLAEATLAVAFPVPGSPLTVIHADRSTLRVGSDLRSCAAGSAATLSLVSVGSPVTSCSLRIVGEHDLPVASGQVGHVQIRGECVTAGYYGPAGPRHDGIDEARWLSTGDLGVFVEGGGLFIVGRHKDTIVVHGQNFHAHDLERICEKVADLEPGKVACIAARDSGGETDSVVVIAQHRKSLEDFVATAVRIKRAISTATGLEVGQVVPVHSLPKTTSGKVQRYSLREAFNRGTFDSTISALNTIMNARVRDRPTLTRIEEVLKEICDTILEDEDIAIDQDLIDYGADSLALSEILAEVDERYPGLLNIEDFLDYPSIAALARFLETRISPLSDPA